MDELRLNKRKMGELNQETIQKYAELYGKSVKEKLGDIYVNP